MPQYMLLSMFLLVACTACMGAADNTTALTGKLTVTGSTALQPLASAAATLFQKQHPGVHINVSGGGSIAGLQAVTHQQGQADIGDSDIYADPAIYPDPNLTDHIVCVIPFTMIVNSGINITSLTQQQIIDIFSTGKIRNWQQVGGPDLPIIPVVRPQTSGTRDTFRKYILGGRDEKGTLLKTDSSVEVRNTVARTPGAIGYLALSVLTSQVHAIAIDGEKPTQANIAAGHYSFWGYEHMYTLGDTTNKVQDAYLDFMLTLTVQQLAQKMGYIPIAGMKLPALSTSSSIASSPLNIWPTRKRGTA
jgi:phosphate transport system substrate-binding protein